jgi:hypothetical protein
MLTESATEQAQAADVAPDTTVATAPESVAPVTMTDPLEILDAITTARMEQAPQEEIERLEALLQVPAESTEAESSDEPVTKKEDEAPEADAQEEFETEQPPTGEQPTEEEPDKTPERFRFKNEDDRLVAQIAKRKGCSLVEAAAIYSGKSAAPPPPEPTAETQDAPEPSPELVALEAEFTQLTEEINQADDSLLRSGLLNEQNRLLRAISKAETKAAVAQLQQTITAKESAKVNEARAVVVADTIKVYPALSDPESAHYMLAAQIALKVADPKHPDHGKVSAVELPRYCAEQAAKKLSIKPKSVATAAPKPTAAAPAVRPPGPASGTKASSPPPPTRTRQEQEADIERATLAVTEGLAAPTFVRRQQSFISV